MLPTFTVEDSINKLTVQISVDLKGQIALVNIFFKGGCIAKDRTMSADQFLLVQTPKDAMAWINRPIPEQSCTWIENVESRARHHFPVW